MKQLVIFDLDGTLLNTIDDLAVAANYALSQCGYPTHEVSEYPHFVGNGINKLLERALPEYKRNETEVERLRASFMPYYDAHNAVYTRPYDGIVDLLEQLRRDGVLLAVASNKYHSATVSIIRHYFPQIDFSVVLGQRDDVPKKPHPAIVNEILERTGVRQQDALYVGDSGVDMTTACAAGVESVGVTWGFRSEAELVETGACHIIHSADELLKYVR